MVGVQFVQVGGTALDLAEVGKLDANAAGFTEDGDFVSEMRVWNGVGYDYYGWSGSSGTDVLDNPDLDNKWVNLDLEIEDGETSDKATGFWIRTSDATAITISGEVPTGATTEVPIVAGFNMIANPYPADVVISDFGTLDNSFAGFTEDGDFITEMRVWNGVGYDYYGWSGTSGSDVLDNSALDNKWVNLDLEAVSAKIPIGNAVWIKAEKNGTITFKNPSSAE